MKIPAELTHKLSPITDIYIPKGKFDTALEFLDDIKKNFPSFHVVDYYRGLCLVNLNKFDQAEPILNNINQSNQLSVVQLVQTNMLLGLIHTENNKDNLAEQDFKNALKINPQSSMATSALGFVYYKFKRYDEALRHFKKAIEIDPNNAGAYNNLSYTLAEIGINVGDAVIAGRKAVALNPDSPAYRDSLGWAYYASQDYGNAVNELQKAFDLLPNHPDIIRHLEQAKKMLKLNRKKKR